MAKTFVLNDENVNRYGYRVLTSGIDLTNFLKNPIALFMHQRASWTLPIGKWVNVRKEGSLLLADIEFDQKDEFALKIESKVEQGILNACSMGFDAKATSSEDVLQGQTHETVTKCELLECSIVDLPGNANSVSLDFHLINQDIEIIPLIKNSLNISNMKKLALKFNLSDTATEDEVLAKVEALETELSNVKAENATLKLDKDTAEKEALIAPHLASGSVVADQKASLLTMDTASLTAFLSKMPKRTLSGQLSSASTEEEPSSKWTFDEWTKKDSAGLLKMKNGTHELYSKDDYARLFKAQYN